MPRLIDLLTSALELLLLLGMRVQCGLVAVVEQLYQGLCR